MTEHNVVHSTFTLERTYAVPPSRVYAAWSDLETKRRWFAGGNALYTLDFRVGGTEVNPVELDGKRITWRASILELVPDERIVYAATLHENDDVATASLTTVELEPAGEGTRLVLVEHGAFLDGRELPEWREQGTGDWLDALGSDLGRTVPAT